MGLQIAVWLPKDAGKFFTCTRTPQSQSSGDPLQLGRLPCACRKVKAAYCFQSPAGWLPRSGVSSGTLCWYRVLWEFLSLTLPTACMIDDMEVTFYAGRTSWDVNGWRDYTGIIWNVQTTREEIILKQTSITTTLGTRNSAIADKPRDAFRGQSMSPNMVPDRGTPGDSKDCAYA